MNTPVIIRCSSRSLPLGSNCWWRWQHIKINSTVHVHSHTNSGVGIGMGVGMRVSCCSSSMLVPTWGRSRRALMSCSRSCNTCVTAPDRIRLSGRWGGWPSNTTTTTLMWLSNDTAANSSNGSTTLARRGENWKFIINQLRGQPNRVRDGTIIAKELRERVRGLLQFHTQVLEIFLDYDVGKSKKQTDRQRRQKVITLEKWLWPDWPLSI